ncbi:MAG: hypothetical protein NVS3B29_04020 [Candidatus Saccharimonadales bacterium]
MKSLALTAILFLHAVGLWGQVPGETKNTLLTHSTDIVPAVATAPAFVPTSLPLHTSQTAINIMAAGAIAVDRASGEVLYEKFPDAPRPIASVTKMATALVISSRHSPDEHVTIPAMPKYPTDAETMGLTPGDTFRLADLLQAALVPSDNDAADALAIIDAGSVPAFADRMNAKMVQWGIAGPHFSGASGLNDTNNFATPASLAKIAGLLLANSTLEPVVGQSSISITSGNGRTYNLRSTNDLLASGQFYGIKTGYTLAAGECFVGLARINGHDVITVVLGSNNRFGDTTTLTNWIGRTWQWL